MSSHGYDDIYSKNKEALRMLDPRANSINATQAQSFDSLARALTAGLNTDLEKVYVIHRWVTSNIAYDTDSYFSNNQSSLRQSANPQNVLKAKLAICDGYSQLMVELGKRAGLKITRVVGFAKGYGYSPGVSVKGSNHAWNIVNIDGKPYLMDSTWDAGGILEGTRKFTRNQGDYKFFLANPDEFITRHFPNQAANQLLDDPWSRTDFSEGRRSAAPRILDN
jgi:transglutaminase/protease-like cytokinesis protein 3